MLFEFSSFGLQIAVLVIHKMDVVDDAAAAATVAIHSPMSVAVVV